MSARKLSRFAGLVFVLAAAVGGVGVAMADAEHGNGGSSGTSVATISVSNFQLIDVIWG